MILWVIRFAIVLLFLVIFLWRSNTASAIGLLTVSLVVLLDALRARELLPDVGYLAWLLGGLAAGGGLVWLWGMFRPIPAEVNTFSPRTAARRDNARERGRDPRPVKPSGTAYDRQMIFDQIRSNLGFDDVLDLVWDMGYNENDIINPDMPMPEIIVHLMDEAEADGKMGNLAVAVERVLTPPGQDDFINAQMVTSQDPDPSMLRHFLVFNYKEEELAVLASNVGVDWSEMGIDAKKSRIRRLLRYLKQRNRLSALVERLQRPRY